MDIDTKNDNNEALSIFNALSHIDRLKMIELIDYKGVPISKLKDELMISAPSLSKHLKILENANLIQTYYGEKNQWKQKFVSLTTDHLSIHFPQKFFPDLTHIRESVKIGHFSNFEATPSCGMATENTIIGKIDDPKSFLNQDRVNASIIWLSQGFIEYKIPKPLQNGEEIAMLDINLELASEFPISNNTWPTNLKIILNGIPIANVTIPGNFSDVRGKYTPNWWDDDFSQYGLLTHMRINQHDTSVDGEKVSDFNLKDTRIEEEDFISFRIETDLYQNRSGGLTLFGDKWGNHPQDINFDFYIS